MLESLRNACAFGRSWCVRAGVSALCLAAVGTQTGCSKITDRDIRIVRLAELKALEKADEADPMALALVDPRSARRFAGGHLPGALNITIPQVDPDGPRRPDLRGHAAIVVYGENPASAGARAMTKRLMQAGYNDVGFYAGGTREYGALYGLVTLPEAPEADTEPDARRSTPN